MDVARCLVARARPTVPEAQLGQSGTLHVAGPDAVRPGRPRARPVAPEGA